MTGQAETRLLRPQAAYDLRKLRGKQLVAKPGRSPQAADTITALLVS